MIMDLVAPLARAFFAGTLPVTLSHGQAAILLCLGLQQIDLTAVETALNLPSNQILALFNKVCDGASSIPLPSFVHASNEQLSMLCSHQ